MSSKLRTYLKAFDKSLPPDVSTNPKRLTPKREPTAIRLNEVLRAVRTGQLVLVSRDIWNEILEELYAHK